MMMRGQFLFLFLFLTFLFASGLKAQPGFDCYSPYVIDTLPFIETGFTTENYPDTYSNSDACNSSYMDGNDFVFTYTPDTIQNVRITLKNTGFLVGVFVMDACPDNIMANCLASATNDNGDPEIYNVELQQNVTYYIVISTRVYISGIYDFTPFDIEVKETPILDATINFLGIPFSRCFMSDSEDINIKVKNLGIDTISNFQLGYKIDDLNEVEELYTHEILPNESVFHTFAITGDFSEPDRIYKIKIFSKLAGDQNIENDTLCFDIMHTTEVSGFPYYEDFESGVGGWYTERKTYSDTLSSWELGIPANSIINSSASENNAWVTDLDGDVGSGEVSFIQGPCFDFTSLIAPVIEFDIWYETSETEFVYVQYSIDSALHPDSWTTLGSTNSGYNWYNTPVEFTNPGWSGSSGGWVHVKHNLEGLGGEPMVLLKFFIEVGGNITGEGVAIDNIEIYERVGNDISVLDIVAPVSGCNLIDNEQIIIEITNAGLDDQTNFELAYTIDDSIVVTEVYNDTISFQDTVVFTFAAAANLSFPGEHSLNVDALSIGDQDSLNNSDSVAIYNFDHIGGLPYYEGFEANNGSWFGTGDLSSWQYGIPADTVINQAATGDYAWVTNITGHHNINERSYLTSPCFDFSIAESLILKMNVWFELELGSYVQFSSSVDDGITWQLIDIDVDSNWYNQGHSWNGSSGGWLEVSNNLQSLAGEPKVQFRFYFYGLIDATGFALDDVTICELPQAGFTYNTDGLMVSFIDTSIASADYIWYFDDDSLSFDQNPVHNYLTGDTVEVTQIVTNLCKSDSITTAFLICDHPLAGFSYNVDGSIISFTDTSSSSDSYYWNFGDDSVSYVQNPEHTFASDDSIEVVLIVSNLCESDTVSQYVKPNAISYLTNDGSFDFYPNPVSNTLYLHFKESFSSAVIKIFDFKGQLVYQNCRKAIRSEEIIQVPVKSYSNGLYIITINSESTSISRKIIFETKE